MANKGNKDNKKQKKLKFKDVHPNTKMTKHGPKVKLDPRQAMEIADPGLPLGHLRVANVARSIDPKGFDHPLDAWSIAEWTNAIAGECGEACNVAKKLLRIRKKTRGNVKKDDKSEKKLLKKLAKEVSDTVAYCDLALASEGISLSDELVKVFNKKSKQLGYDFML